MKKLRTGENTPATDKFLRCANFILQWLNPQDLASVSQTCKPLSQISKSITLQRSLDATRSLENFPIPFCNTVDSKRYAYFIYTPFQIPASCSLKQRWGLEKEERARVDSVSEGGRFGVSLEDEFGCECERCEEGCCECLGGGGVEEIRNECGSGCGCGLDCSNRVSQKGISVRLKIVRDEKKGWCLFADEVIKKGQFICEYAGELLTTDEARRRQTLYDKLRSTQPFSSALLVIREHLPSGQACLRINIDATRIGNVARFINHSCDGGNLSTVLLRSAGALLPRLCFFAARDIAAEEELSFSYGDVRLTTENNNDNKLNCCCGSSCCLGTLPCENT